MKKLTRMHGMLHPIKMMALTAMLCVAVVSINAMPLTPDQALQMLRTQGNRVAPMAASGQLRLSYTQMDLSNAQPAVYVFDRKDAPGFRVVAADDCIGDILLGYSDTESFDPNNIPEGLQWLMGAYAQYISLATSQPAKARTVASYTAVTPLVNTMWDQDEPYNNNCPKVNGQRSVTGCVATAMAQVMKVHNYPTKGKGSNSYNWQVDGKSYSLSTDFASHTYDWKNMLNSYNSLATTTQKDAVALLMADCGAACEMVYSPESSGSNQFSAGGGMINYFNYDQSMKLYLREWFSSQEWSDIIYDQVRNGLPVLFAGNDANSGHEFVIDGCDSKGMFHVNWGWGGLANGYYSISDLTPTEIGIGGGLGSYNSGQQILVDIKPNASGKCTPIMAVNERLAFDRTSYNKAAHQDVALFGGFASYCLINQDFEIGIKFVSGSNTQYKSIGSIGLQPGEYLLALQLDTDFFPTGEYDVAVAFRALGTGEWCDFYFNDPTSPRSYHVINKSTDQYMYISSGMGGDDPQPPTSVTVSAEAVEIVPRNSEDNDNVYPGHTYDFVYNVTATGACDYTVLTALLDLDGNLTDYGDLVSMKFSSAGTQRVTTPFSLDKDLASGTYYFCLASVDEDNYLNQISDFYKIEIGGGAEEIYVEGQFINITPNNGDDQGIYPGHAYTIKYDVAVNQPCELELYALVITPEFQLYDKSDPVRIKFDKAGNKVVGITYQLPDNMPIGQYDLALAFLGGDTFYLVSSLTTIDVVEFQTPVTKPEYEAELTGVSPLDETDKYFYPGHGYLVGYDVTSTLAATEVFYTVIINEEYQILAMSEGVAVTFNNAGESRSVVNQIEIPSSLAPGTYYIGMVYDDGEYYNSPSGFYRLDVSEYVVRPSDVILDVTSVEMKVGESVKLTATVLPENTTDKTVVWSTSDSSVATVDENGGVTALSEGSATITATCGDVTATCNVTVKSLAGVIDALGDVISYHVVGNQLIVRGLPAGENFALYRADGTLVYAGNSNCVPLANNTVYILTYKGQLVKIVAAR